MAKPNLPKQKKGPWATIIGILLILFILSYIASGLLSLALGAEFNQGNVAIIPVKGVITTASQPELFAPGIASSSIIVQQLKEAQDNPSIKAVILEIDSPGGAPVASDEIATAVKRMNKTTVAWIRESGASGAYWVASASDHIIANKLSITGSIGVIGSYLDFSGLLADYNVSYEQLTAGKYKDVGIPFRSLSQDERTLLQKKINLMHQVFKDDVAVNRNLTRAEIDALATGEFYLGMEALNVGLVDELGGEEEALAYVASTLNIVPEPVRYERAPGLLQSLVGLTQTSSSSVQAKLPSLS